MTSTVLDASGNTGVGIEISIPSASIASGDVLGGELSIRLDDGSGGATAVFQFMCRLRANTTYADTPQYVPTVAPKVTLTQPVNERVALLPIVSPAATPATCQIAVVALTNALTPFRLLVALPRAFKLPATY